MTIDNPFGIEGAGVQYARGRPYHHPVTLARALELLGVTRAATALDVACGTGLSTRALADVAHRVAGCEVSAAMLRAAPTLDNVSYVRAAAEMLPFAPASFDGPTARACARMGDRDRRCAVRGRNALGAVSLRGYVLPAAPAVTSSRYASP